MGVITAPYVHIMCPDNTAVDTAAQRRDDWSLRLGLEPAPAGYARKWDTLVK